MTVPPDFGGRALEEDLPEDLGAPPEEHSVAQEDQDEGEWSGNELRAEGQVCARCGAAIQPGQDTRLRADGQWVHEICPLPA